MDRALGANIFMTNEAIVGQLFLAVNFAEEVGYFFVDQPGGFGLGCNFLKRTGSADCFTLVSF